MSLIWTRVGDKRKTFVSVLYVFKFFRYNSCRKPSQIPGGTMRLELHRKDNTARITTARQNENLNCYQKSPTTIIYKKDVVYGNL